MDIYSPVKTCSKCGIEKPVSNFTKDKQKKDGYGSQCKSCKKEQSQKYYQDNKESIKNSHSLWRENNPDKLKKYYEDNKESLKQYQKDYNKKNKEHIKKRQQEYCKKNKESLIEWRKNYNKQKYQTDELFVIRQRIGRLIRISIKNKGYSKKSKTHEILGCSYDEFKLHIESQFLEGMNWDNRSEWHLDHITPVSWGNTEEEVIKLNHYTNFQPLWATDNWTKNNHYSG